MTDTWVLVVWWIGLIGALPLTVIIVKEVRLVLDTLDDIHRLAQRTATAAEGIAAHVSPIGDLPAALGTGDPLIQASRRVSAASVGIAEALDANLGPSGMARLGGWIAEWIRGRRAR